MPPAGILIPGLGIHGIDYPPCLPKQSVAPVGQLSDTFNLVFFFIFLGFSLTQKNITEFMTHKIRATGCSKLEVAVFYSYIAPLILGRVITIFITPTRRGYSYRYSQHSI